MHSLIDLVEDLAERPSKKPRCVALFGVDLQTMWEACTKVFEVIDAGGGLVRQEPSGALLFIFRNKKWDLPKGKAEKGETIPETALREVEEECGMHNLVLGPPLVTTYHVYGAEGARKLKRSFWFLMHSTQMELVPQLEEGITQVTWVAPEAVHQKLKKAYPSIAEVIQAYWFAQGQSSRDHRFRLF